MARLIEADGTERVVTPSNGKKFTMEEVWDILGGYFERVPLAKGQGRGLMYIDEEGKLKGLPVNDKATAISRVAPSDVIVGPALLPGPGEF